MNKFNILLGFLAQKYLYDFNFNCFIVVVNQKNYFNVLEIFEQHILINHK